MADRQLVPRSSRHLESADSSGEGVPGRVQMALESGNDETIGAFASDAHRRRWLETNAGSVAETNHRQNVRI